jgi:phage shock protein PspC (stress-responsive transcriptional regulator)
MNVQPQQPPSVEQEPSPPPGDDVTLDGSLAGARAWFAHHGLVRPRRGKMIAGVCAALGRRYGINVLVMRVLFVVAALAGVPVLLYVALWVLMPKEE